MMDRPLFIPAESRPTRDQLIAKLVRANEAFPEQEEALMKYAEQVPLKLMLPARDLMRGPGQQHFDRPGDAWTGLSNDIAERGILSPIFLEWSTADGYAYAGEGNTRLAVADQLGLETVPVVVYRKSLPLQGSSRTGEIGPFEFNKRQYLLDQGITEDMPSWKFKLEDGYVPQYFQPHYLIGFLDQRIAGRLDLPDKYRDEDDWFPYTPQTYYHISNPKHRPSILEHGIDWQRSHPDDRLQNNDLFPDEEWPRGNYLFRDWHDADLGPDDIYEVNAEGLNLLPDPYHDPESGIVYSPDVIPPDRLKLVKPGSWA